MKTLKENEALELAQEDEKLAGIMRVVPRFAPVLRAQDAEIERLQAELLVQTKAADHWMTEATRDHNDLAKLKQQEPIGQIGGIKRGRVVWFDHTSKLPEGTYFYLAAGAQQVSHLDASDAKRWRWVLGYYLDNGSFPRHPAIGFKSDMHEVESEIDSYIAGETAWNGKFGGYKSNNSTAPRSQHMVMHPLLWFYTR